MTKTRAELTELEGTILGVVRRGGPMTAYAVRSVFLSSVSAEWSGSAGAVYPAITRLVRAGFLKESAVHDGRRSKTYALTRSGIAANDSWICDIGRAAGAGQDPFRIRAALWSLLPASRRGAMAKALIEEMKKRQTAVTAGLQNRGDPDAIMDQLYCMLLEQRIGWIKEKFN